VTRITKDPRPYKTYESLDYNTKEKLDGNYKRIKGLRDYI